MGLSEAQRRSEQLWWARDMVEDFLLEQRPDLFPGKFNVVETVEKHEDKVIEALKNAAKEIETLIDNGDQ